MIVIVAKPSDLHARCVAAEIARLGEKVEFLDMARLAADGRVAHRIGPRGTATVAVDGGVGTRLLEAKTIWYRRPSRPEISLAVIDSVDRRFAAREWAHAMDGLLLSAGGRVVNDINSQAAAVKPRQLEVARAVGLRHPATLITNDPTEARAFVSEYRGCVIHKALTAPPHRMLDTRRWGLVEEQELPQLSVAPVILQEEIAGNRDVRATVVGRLVFAALITSSPGQTDSRLSLDAPHVPYELPEAVYDGLLRLMGQLGLTMGTVDFKLTDDDEHVFLEVNPQGQFLYIEILTDMPISAAVANLLVQGGNDDTST